MKLCVGICVGITFDCFLLIILNHEVKLNVRVRPSHSPSKHFSPMPLHKPFPWIIPFHHRQSNLLPCKIPKQPPNNPIPIHRLRHEHPHTLIQPNRALIKRLMMNRTQRQSVRDLTRSAKLLPLDMRSFKSNRGVIMPHVESTDCALIVIST